MNGPNSGNTWRRVVVKVGTSTLTAGSGCLNAPRMVDLVRQLAALCRGACQVVLVSSGAQQAGRERLGYPKEDRSIPFKQMLAAVGQGRLMQLWEQYFDLYDVVVAQVLLTREDVEDRQRYLNLRDTFESLLRHGIVPIVNENDAVATDEIKVGENDSLSAMVANLIEADLLILLTDTDGLYTKDPAVDPNARLIERVETIDNATYQLARGSKSEMGTGGMYTKIVAAEMAVRSGTSVVIANGARENVLADIGAGKAHGTWFPTHITPAEGRKRWLLAQAFTAASITIDNGASEAILKRGKSLLPVGIVDVRGDFERGALLGVRTLSGREIARGLCNYNSRDLRRILGQRSGDITELLGYDYGPAFIHRDNMVLLAPEQGASGARE
ncbi:MAG: glutamate 5-kinase [Chloroflexi bacterium RBG_13_56_8]|nr:MAG: glutamate 5-kinase [Chloroflexi bacterium RBG_13_56_8]